MKKLGIITCPHCGREYMASEIYLPKVFFGEPSGIQRDISGKIIETFGKEPDLQELYICDGCENPFRIYAEVSFTTVSDKALTFTGEYRTKL